MPAVSTSEKESVTPVSDGELAYFDQTLWTRFQTADTVDEFASAWLNLQCAFLPEVTAGVIVLERADSGVYSPVATWPEGQTSSEMLGAAAESALSTRKGVANKSGDRACAAYPILLDGQVQGVAAVDMLGADEASLRSVMRRLQWGCGWLEANLRRQAGNYITGRQSDAALVVELAALVLETERFHDAATALVTELATRLQCDRVSLGLRERKNTRVLTLSHSAQFGKNTNLMRAIGAAMDEAIDQRGELLFPQAQDSQLKVDRAHARLQEVGGGKCICTLPLATADRFFGAITLESSQEQAFTPEQLASFVHIAAFLGPLLANKRSEDRWIGRKIYQSFARQFGRLFGAGYVGRKLLAMALLAAVVYMLLATDVYRVRATATIEGAIERVTVAPINGYIAEAIVRAGDVVEQGALLFRIDDRDLRLEYLKWSSQKEQIQRRLRDALAQHERSEVNILRAQLEQADAQLALVNEQIIRTRVTAPFDGIIVSGDLSDQLGAPVERGQVLFQIAPLNEYRVALQVSEKEVSTVEVGQTGKLILAAMPGQGLTLQIDSITPVSNIANGENTFRVEASLADHPEFLRPGMQGAARIAIGERKLAWIWTHDLISWVRFRIWSWWP